MAARKFTAQELIKAVRDTGMVPNTGSTGTEDDDLLDYIDQAIATILLPRVLAIREEFCLKRVRIPLVSGTALYRVPHRAVYSKIRDVFYVDSDESREVLMKYAQEDVVHIRHDGALDNPEGFVMEGDYIHLLPDQNTSFSGYIEVIFYMRPSDMLKTTSAGVVSSVVGKVITCTGDVSTLFSAGDKIDIHSPYSGADQKFWDLTVSTVNVADVTVLEDIDGTTYGTHAAAALDYVVPAEMCAIPPLPRDLHNMIARAAAVYIAESIGDAQAIQFHGALLNQNLNDCFKAMENRVESKPMRITGKNSFIGW